MAGIQHASDVRMSQRREDLPLLEEAFALRVARTGREQFHGQALSDFAIGALGQIDRAHAAASDYVQQPVGACAPPLSFKLRKGPAGSDAHVELEEGIDSGVKCQERLDFLAYLLVHLVLPKIPGAIRGRQVRYFVKQFCDADVHPAISLCSQARARRSSRRTTCTERDNTVADSSS